MSKVSEAFENGYWGEQFFENKRADAVHLKEVNKEWGDRSYLNKLGKPIKEMNWYEKPKRILSPKVQMEKYFNWFDTVKDNRTRRIITAEFVHYYEEIYEDEYHLVKDKRETVVEVKKGLYFDMGRVPLDHPLEFSAKFIGQGPIDTYKYWFEENDEEHIEFAKEYGIIQEFTTYKLKKTVPSHRMYNRYGLDKYLYKHYAGKFDSYFNTSMTYQILKDKKAVRQGGRVTEYCLLFSELDFYKMAKYKGISQKKMLEMVYKALDEAGFPRPTEVVFPRGLHLVWKINPIPSYRYDEWMMLQLKLHSILVEFGADSQVVTDRVRLLRLVGTIHSKTGKKIWGESFTDDRYLFDEIFDLFCKEEWEKEKEKRKKRRLKHLQALQNGFEKENKNKTNKNKNNTTRQKRKEKKDHTSHYVGNLIHEKYLKDLIKLIDLRDGYMDGYREFCCFLVRYWVLCITEGDDEKAIEEMQKVYDSMSIDGAYTWSEIISYSQSAVKGYERWSKNIKKGYNYSNDTLAFKLDITSDEQKQLDILMGKSETARRERERDMMKKRDKRKSVSQEEHQQQLEESKEDKLWSLKKSMERYPEWNNPQLADYLGVSTKTVQRWKKELAKKEEEQKEEIVLKKNVS